MFLEEIQTLSWTFFVDLFLCWVSHGVVVCIVGALSELWPGTKCFILVELRKESRAAVCNLCPGHEPAQDVEGGVDGGASALPWTKGSQRGVCALPWERSSNPTLSWALSLCHKGLCGTPSLRGQLCTSLGERNLRAPSIDVTAPQTALSKRRILDGKSSVPICPNSCLLRDFLLGDFCC